MNDLAIRLNDLSKLYRIGGKKERYKTLRDTLTDSIAAPFRRLAGMFGCPNGESYNGDETIWALKHVSFEIKQGELVGIIGRNGAGKSTLLKILSRITEPTSGYAEIRGRVGSLLEVGTGFHHELTGRENIYLNGAILGMKKAEIERRFDEIVAFAEVDKFIDTPVKHYSTGMYLRLAFAVAAHLEPEILIVDEVLAVGDANFQRKCLNKMDTVGKQGRTVLFVSHNMMAITRLCERAILLEDGQVIADGPSHKVISEYVSSGVGVGPMREWPNPIKAPGGGVARLLAVRVRTAEGKISDVIDIREPLKVEMEYEVITPGYRLMPHFAFSNEEGIYAFSAHDVDPAWRGRARPAGRYLSAVWIPGHLLTEGIMFVAAGVQTIDPVIRQFFEANAVSFQVVESQNGDGARGEYGGRIMGVVRPLLKWTTEYSGSRGTNGEMDFGR
jgi:lipopolysaccharide transport system ATP-binding protein